MSSSKLKLNFVSIKFKRRRRLLSKINYFILQEFFASKWNDISSLLLAHFTEKKIPTRQSIPSGNDKSTCLAKVVPRLQREREAERKGES